MDEAEKKERIRLLRKDLSRVVKAHLDSMPKEDPLGIGIEALGLAFADEMVTRIFNKVRIIPTDEFMMSVWRQAQPEMHRSFIDALDELRYDLMQTNG